MDTGAIEAPARRAAVVRENRANASLRLRLIVKDFDFAVLHGGGVIERDRLERIVGFGISHSVLEPQEIACI
ncbi:MAG: hypothetical protein DMG32_09475 [Acidobacteria bacterium]|nr:MAG: hypothetical protein DMG32_09475 [Acidobacteriota bacterium]